MKKPNRIGRTAVPADVESAVLVRSNRRCCLCFCVNKDEQDKLGQIAHLDHNPANNDEGNLAFLCLHHHTLYDSRTSQHKNYTIDEVRKHRATLYASNAAKGHCEWRLVLDGSFSEFDKARVTTIAEHLSKLLGDPSLTIKRVDPGSVVLTVSSSRAAVNRLLDRLADAEVTIDGLVVLRVLPALDEGVPPESSAPLPKVSPAPPSGRRSASTTGTIKRITDKGFGFIATPDGTEYFFHQSACTSKPFDSMREGDRVTFTVGEGPKGPRAENVSDAKR